jgi:hypothetical protein
MKFKPNEEVVVSDNYSELLMYNAQEFRSKRGHIVCSGTREGYDGYEVLFVDAFGHQTINFIRLNHLVPAPNRYISKSEPKWKRVAKEWEDKLWKDKIGDKDI